MAIKVQIFYNQGTLGFSETWYLNTTSTPNQINLNLPQWGSFFRASIACRGNLAYIYGARVSQVLPPHATVPWFFGSKYSVNNSAVTTPETATSLDALLYIYDINSNKRPLYIRALNATFIQYSTSGAPNLSPQGSSAVNSYVYAAISLQLCLQITNKPGAGAAGYNTINTLQTSPVNPNWTRIQASFPQVYPSGPGTYARFYKINRNAVPGFPKLITVVGQGVVGGNQYYDVPYLYRGVGVYSPANATMVIQSSAYNQILNDINNAYSFVRFAERKTGRPFGQLRGRARSVVRAQ